MSKCFDTQQIPNRANLAELQQMIAVAEASGETVIHECDGDTTPLAVFKAAARFVDARLTRREQAN
jgi:hypothetical protein